MPSIAAQNVAKEVISKVRKGERPILGKIIPKHGYSPSIATHPNKVTRTDSYKEVIEPIVSAMERERNRLIKAMSERELTGERYRDLTDGIDKLTKNIQLLSGGATANIQIKPLATLEELKGG